MDRFVVRAAWICTLSLITSACGGGSSSSSNEPAVVAEVPKIAVTNALSLEAGINETSVASVSISNTGAAALTYAAASGADWLTVESPTDGTVSPNNERTLTVRATCGDQSQMLSSEVALTTNDPNAGSVNVPVTLECEDQRSDLAIARVLMNQGVRAYDTLASTAQTTSLIANREMLVRVFATSTGTRIPAGQVIVSRPGFADTTVALTQPSSIGPTPADAFVLGGSHYAIVPGSAVQDGASLHVVLDPDANQPVRYPAVDNIEPNVRDLADFRITFVPVTFDSQTPSVDATERMATARKVLPVGGIDADIREPYIFTGTYDLSRLLDEIRVLRDLDGSNRLYHAIIPEPTGTQGSVAGIGYVGFPVSVSMDLGDDSYLIAHELGHNLSREHAPGCSTPNADTDYPDPLGGIGSWGFDFQTATLIEPTQGVFDFMSYCNDLWVSDYGFEMMAAFRDPPFGNSGTAGSTKAEKTQLKSDVRGPEGSYVISGQMHRSGNEFAIQNLIPSATAPPSVTSGRFRFVARDAVGSVVGHARFNAAQIDHSEQAGFSFRIPKPTTPIYHIEISDGEQVVYERIQPRVHNDLAPATVRSTDNALTWRHDQAIGAVIRNAAGRVLSIDKTGRLALPAADAVTVEVFGEGWQAPARRIQIGKPFSRVQ